MRCTIELCSKFITPSRLFLKDKMNILYAEQKNYKVIQLWESDINEAKKKKVLETYILKNINPYLIQLNNTKN